MKGVGLVLAVLAFIAVGVACTVDLRFDDPPPDADWIPPDAGEPDASYPGDGGAFPDAAPLDALTDSGTVTDAEPPIDS